MLSVHRRFPEPLRQEVERPPAADPGGPQPAAADRLGRRLQVLGRLGNGPADGTFYVQQSVDGRSERRTRTHARSDALPAQHRTRQIRCDVSTLRGLGGGPEILFYRFDDQKTLTVYRLPRRVALGLSVAPDESWLLFSQLDGSGADLMLIDAFSAGR